MIGDPSHHPIAISRAAWDGFGEPGPGGEMKIVAMILALAAPLSPPATEAALAPSGKWNIEYANNLCLLSREFGAGDAKIRLGIRPTRLGSFTQLVLIRPVSVGKTSYGDARVTLMPSGVPAKASYNTYKPVKDIGQITTVEVRSQALAGLESTNEIAVTLGKGAAIRVAPTGMVKAMAALRVCEDDLLASWGVDPKKQASLAKKAEAIGSRADFWPSGIYPSGNPEGTVLVGYTVQANGRVANCRILSSSKNAELDKLTCQSVTWRGRYHPAIGQDGKPSDSFETNRVIWVVN
ncbi:TonB family protein [Sphingomonas sp. ERG5]|uniref:TonB family protein n=1 Tax=Sphingomonas sp. ERG5 TaxID=1381597 RepID=UPI001364AC5C|nr:TonB family protein [Sphingomonas sp. ERG5]